MVPIPTARGDEIDSSELGFTLITESIVGPRTIEKEMNWPDHTFKDTPEEKRIADAVAKLEVAKDGGVDTISDRVIPGIGRDVPLVKKIAEQTRVNIIVPTGWYTWQDAPHGFMLRDMFPDSVSKEEPSLADLFVRDCEEGILDTGVRAGTIKFATDRHGFTDGVRLVIRASAEAHRRTGVPITTHTGIGIGVTMGRGQQDALEELGVDLTRVNLGHVDWTDPDTPLDEFEHALQRGSFISFDTIGLDFQWPPEFGAKITAKRIERIVSLVEKGYVEQIMLSHDQSTYYDVEPMPENLPYPTYLQLSRELIPQLKEHGVTDDQVTQMMVHNPRRFLESRGLGAY